MTEKVAQLTGESLSKTFGVNVALSQVSFQVSTGEILAIVGGNGSGKSTLLKITYGNLKADSGRVSVDGNTLKQDPHESRMHGVEMVFQDKDDEAKLCSGLSVLENLFLGREPTSRLGIISISKMHQMATEVINHYRFPFPSLGSTVRHLSGGQQKAVAIGRALLSRPRFLLLDEPSASLGLTERGFVHEALNELKAAGVGIILCSHSLEEVMKIADRVMALRSGQMRIDTRVTGMSAKDIALLMSE
jgi:ABC-type sugar transport system ATPase subunit